MGRALGVQEGLGLADDLSDVWIVSFELVTDHDGFRQRALCLLVVLGQPKDSGGLAEEGDPLDPVGFTLHQGLACSDMLERQRDLTELRPTLGDAAQRCALSDVVFEVTEDQECPLVVLQ